MVSAEGFLSGGPAWEVFEPWDSLLWYKVNDIIFILYIETILWNFFEKKCIYLSTVSFFAGGELLFFESVDSRLQ